MGFAVGFMKPFLTSLMQLKNSYFSDGANFTKAGMIDYVLALSCLMLNYREWMDLAYTRKLEG